MLFLNFLFEKKNSIFNVIINIFISTKTPVNLFGFAVIRMVLHFKWILTYLGAVSFVLLFTFYSELNFMSFETFNNLLIYFLRLSLRYKLFYKFRYHTFFRLRFVENILNVCLETSECVLIITVSQMHIYTISV